MSKIISVINYKGGTGKTTITYHLGFTMEFILNYNKNREKDFKVLLIDNDPQSSLTKMFFDPEEEFTPDQTIYSIYDDEPNYTKDIIKKTQNPNVDLVPNVYLTSRRNDVLLNRVDGLYRLKKFIDLISDEYDVILIDNNPTVTMFTKNCFLLNSYVLIPTEPTKMSSEGIKEILKDISTVRNTINPNFNLLGIVINRINRRYKNHKFYRELLLRTFGDLVLRSEISQRVLIQMTERKKIPITEYKNEKSYQDFKLLSKEILNRLEFGVDYDESEYLNYLYSDDEDEEIPSKTDVS